MGGKLSKNVGFLQKMRVFFLPLPGSFFPDSGKMTGKLHANKKNAEWRILKTEKGRREKRKKRAGLSSCPPPRDKKKQKSHPATESGMRTQVLLQNGSLRTATRISYALSRKLEKKGKHLSRCAEEKAES